MKETIIPAAAGFYFLKAVDLCGSIVLDKSAIAAWRIDEEGNVFHLCAASDGAVRRNPGIPTHYAILTPDGSVEELGEDALEHGTFDIWLESYFSGKEIDEWKAQKDGVVNASQA